MGFYGDIGFYDGLKFYGNVGFYKGADSGTAKIYGVSWNKAGSTMTRTDDAIGLTAIPNGQNDFMTLEYFKDITEVTDLYNNKFVRLPKLYIKKTDSESLKTIQISKKPFEGAYLPWCFWDFANNRELPYIDIGKHRGVSSDGIKLESKPSMYPTINKNIVQFRGMAKANGAGYQIEDVHTNDLLTVLFLVMFATVDSQSVMQGYVSGQWTTNHLATIAESNTNRIVIANAYADQYRVGQAISIGTSQGGNQIFYGRTIQSINIYDASNKSIVFDGAPVNIAVGNMVYNTGYKTGWSNLLQTGWAINNDGKSPMSFLGIESIYGDMWRFVDGININNNQSWVCKDASLYASNLFANPYEQLGYINSNSNNNLQQLGFDGARPYAEFPKTTGSTNVTYKDYYWQDTGQRIARVGAAWDFGSAAGLSSWLLHTSSGGALVAAGARLVRKAI